MSEPKVTYNVNVGATIQGAGGVTTTINERTVTISKPGPNGGRGDSVSIGMQDWDAIVAAVAKVRAGITEANAIIQEKIGG